MTAQYETQKDLKLFVIISEAVPTGDTYLIYKATIFCSFFLKQYSQDFSSLATSGVEDQRDLIPGLCTSTARALISYCSFIIFSFKRGNKTRYACSENSTTMSNRRRQKVRQNGKRHLGTLTD